MHNCTYTWQIAHLILTHLTDSSFRSRCLYIFRLKARLRQFVSVTQNCSRPHPRILYNFLTFVASTWTLTGRVSLHCANQVLKNVDESEKSSFRRRSGTDRRWGFSRPHKNTDCDVIVANIVCLFLPLSYSSWLLLYLLLFLLVLRSPAGWRHVTLEI